MDAIPGCTFYQADMLDPSFQQTLLADIQRRDVSGHTEKTEGGKRRVDVVLSDMAPSFSGNHFADQARTTVSILVIANAMNNTPYRKCA
jgi:23S rRNA U2552 (ribose-2'-O)-methylase RlmE/FtsJ